MNLFTGLLFQQGYIQDPKLALSLAGADKDESADAGTDPAPADAGAAADRGARRPYHHGAIRDWCSVALSPFR